MLAFISVEGLRLLPSRLRFQDVLQGRPRETEVKVKGNQMISLSKDSTSDYYLAHGGSCPTQSVGGPVLKFLESKIIVAQSHFGHDYCAEAK